LNHLKHNFQKIGIIESFGVLGEESSVYHKFAWSHPIAAFIEHSPEPFYEMFRRLTFNWNKYILEVELQDLIASFEKLQPLLPQSQQMLNKFQARLQALIREWNDDKFAALFNHIHQAKESVLSTSALETQCVIDGMYRDLNFANRIRPGVGLQFTLSDVIVAMAITDHSSFFSCTPVQIHVNERSFLQIFADPSSNVFYYDQKEHGRFTDLLLPKL
jgi:hypothetical protein